MKALLAVTFFSTLAFGLKDIPDLYTASSVQECTPAIHNLFMLGHDPTCNFISQYATCVIRTLGLHLRNPTPEDKETFSRSLVEIQQKFQLKCDIDMYTTIEAYHKSLLQEIVNWLKEAWWTKKIPDDLKILTNDEGSSIENPRNKSDCIKALFRSETYSDGVTCHEARKFTECMIVSQSLYMADLPTELLDNFTKDVLNVSSEVEAPCSIDLSFIWSQLRQLVPLLNVPMAEPPMLLTSHDGPESDFDKAPTQLDCINLLAVEIPTFTCLKGNEWAKCMIRTQGIHNQNLSEEEIDKMEAEFEAELERLGLTCDIDLREILRVLRKNGTPPSSSSTTDSTTTASSSSSSSSTDSTTTSISTDKTTSTFTTTASTSADTTTLTIAFIPTTPTTATTSITTTATTPDSTTVSSTTPTAPPPTPSPTTLTTTTTKRPGFLECLVNTAVSCALRPRGDYGACFPLCQKGVYISCVNRKVTVRNCTRGWYVRKNGERFLAKMVYDPFARRCVRKSSSCPRYLDDMVERKV